MHGVGQRAHRQCSQQTSVHKHIITVHYHSNHSFTRYKTTAALSQGNRAMQRVFPTPNGSLNVICFSLQKVKAAIAPAVIYGLKAG